MPVDDTHVGAAETHGAVVFFLGNRAFKVKKPVRFEFFDFSTPELRRSALERELALNRRLAPDVYLDVATLVGSDTDLAEPVLVMRRMPSDRRLATRVRDGEDVDACVREVARVVAAFHLRADTGEAIAARGRPEEIRGDWDDNFEELEPFTGEPLDADVLDLCKGLAHRYIAGRHALFEQRRADDLIRDGHGDLLADDIFCLDDGPRILDCIEFNDVFRWGDVLADTAFLAMDLERLGAPEAAEAFMRYYRQFSGESHPDSLADLYIAYRALVRAKIACLRWSQGEAHAAGEAERLLALCHRRLRKGRVRLVLVGGAPGTGKSTLAAGLSDRLGWSVLRSDETRKDISGRSHEPVSEVAPESGIYTQTMTDATYAELLQRAETLLEDGESVILDASWTRAAHRDRAAALADATDAELISLCCVTPPAVADERIADRRADPQHASASDAGPAVAAHLRAARDPWPDAIDIDTSSAPDSAVEAAARRVE